jgi:hypothetical protein
MYKTTVEYYNMSVDRLLVQPLKESVCTTEELLLVGEGSACIFYDDTEDMNYWADEREYKNVKLILKTINERIAVIME